MKTIHTNLTEEQVERLAELKKRTGIIRSEAIRRAVDAYLEKKRHETVQQMQS